MRVGINSRLDTIQAAVLLPKLEILDSEITARGMLAKKYNLGLKGASGIQTPVIPKTKKSAWAQYTLVCEDREEIQKKLS